MSLDDTLAAWAAAVALPDDAAAEIYRRIVPEPVRLSGAWWRDYTAVLTTSMVASMRPVRWAA